MHQFYLLSNLHYRVHKLTLLVLHCYVSLKYTVMQRYILLQEHYNLFHHCFKRSVFFYVCHFKLLEFYHRQKKYCEVNGELHHIAKRLTCMSPSCRPPEPPERPNKNYSRLLLRMRQEDAPKRMELGVVCGPD